MAKEVIPFESFVEAVGEEHADFVNDMNDYLTENGCVVEIKEAKNGYVVSYKHKPTKRTLMNYVFRKPGPMMRIYGDNVQSYMEQLDKWPDSMKAAVKKAGNCRRLLNPEDCNSRCPMGFDFILDGERQQKCRYGGFMFFLSDETKPHLGEMLKCEISAIK